MEVANSEIPTCRFSMLHFRIDWILSDGVGDESDGREHGQQSGPRGTGDDLAADENCENSNREHGSHDQTNPTFSAGDSAHGTGGRGSSDQRLARTLLNARIKAVCFSLDSLTC
jgi:hypothetical protein